MNLEPPWKKKLGLGPDFFARCPIFGNFRQGTPDNPAGYPASGKKIRFGPTLIFSFVFFIENLNLLSMKNKTFF